MSPAVLARRSRILPSGGARASRGWGERRPATMSVRNTEGRLFEHVRILQVSNNRYQVRNLARLGALPRRGRSGPRRR